MTSEKYRNIYRLCRYSRDELRKIMNDLYDQPRTDERAMKLQAVERLIREQSITP